MGSECLSSLGGVSECDLHDSWDPNPKRKEMDTLQTGQGGEQGQLEHLGVGLRHLGVKCFLKACWEMCQSSEADPEGQALGPAVTLCSSSTERDQRAVERNCAGEVCRSQISTGQEARTG